MSWTDQSRNREIQGYRFTITNLIEIKRLLNICLSTKRQATGPLAPSFVSHLYDLKDKNGKKPTTVSDTIVLIDEKINHYRKLL